MIGTVELFATQALMLVLFEHRLSENTVLYLPTEARS